MDESVDEGVEGESGGLEEAVEVDGGVVGDEGGAEVHVPGHFLQKNRKSNNVKWSKQIKV